MFDTLFNHDNNTPKKFAAIALFAIVLFALLFGEGCSTAESAQPAKSQTQTNDVHDNIIIVATQCTVSNRIVRAEGTNDMPPVELFTQTQSLESSGTESFAQTASQTPTNDIKPDVDLRYNDAIAGATSASKGVLETLTSAGRDKVLQMMSDKTSGTVQVQKKDGTTTTIKCENGQCEECKDCTPQ